MSDPWEPTGASPPGDDGPQMPNEVESPAHEFGAPTAERATDSQAEPGKAGGEGIAATPAPEPAPELLESGSVGELAAGRLATAPSAAAQVGAADRTQMAVAVSAPERLATPKVPASTESSYAAAVAAELATMRLEAARSAAEEAEAERRRRERAARPSDLIVDHVGASGHSYPTESLSFLTRVRVVNQVAGIGLNVSLPPAVEIADTDEPRGTGRPQVTTSPDECLVRWELDGPFEGGSELLFSVEVITPDAEALRPDPAGLSRHSMLVSRARATAPGAQLSDAASAWALVEVRPRARYLSYLPAVFERDALMSRFLMAFESFMGPIEAQVREIDSYFSASVAPLPMLHWMADRLDVELDSDWDEEVQRRMLSRTIQLYRRRGTRDGLQEMLEVYSGGEVTIVERRSENFMLGKESRLGSAVALGSANQPHSFSVFLKLPPVRATRREVAEQLRELRRQRIQRLIDSERPAHVRYTFEVEEG